jgi:hypothetical protein
MQETVELINVTESLNSAKLNESPSSQDATPPAPTDEDRAPTDDASSSRILQRRHPGGMGLVALVRKTSRSLTSPRSNRSFGSVKSHKSSLAGKGSVHKEKLEEDLLKVASEASKPESFDEAPLEEIRDTVEELVAPTESVPTHNDEASVASFPSSKASRKSMKAVKKLFKRRISSSAHSKSVGSVKSFESSLAVKESVHEEVEEDVLSVASVASKAESINEAPLEEVQNCVEEHVAPAKTVPTSNDEASVALSTSSKASKKSMKAGEKLMKNRSASSAHSKSVGSVKSFESSLAVKESVHEEVEEDVLSVAAVASKAESINEAPLEEVQNCVEEPVAPAKTVPTSNDEASVALSTSSKASKKSMKAGEKLMKNRSASSAHSKSVGSVKSFESSLAVKESVHEEVEEDVLSVAAVASKAESINEAPLEEVQNCVEEPVAPAKTVPTSNDEASVALSTTSKASKKSMKAGEKLMKNRSTSSAHSKSVGSVKSFESSLAVKESVHEEEVFGGVLSVASEASNAASVNETFLEELRDSVEEHVAPSEGVPTQNDETSVASFASSKASKKSLKAGKKLLKIKNKVRDASMRYIGLTKSVKKQGESVRSQPEVSEPTENEIEDESLKEKNEIVDEKNLAPEEKAKEIEKVSSCPWDCTKILIKRC